MTLPDLDHLPDEDLQALLSRVYAEVQRRATLATAPAEAVETTEALIGPLDKEGTAPGLETIQGVLRYTPADMAANPELAFPLAFQGLLVLAEATLKIARVVGSETD